MSPDSVICRSSFSGDYLNPSEWPAPRNRRPPTPPPVRPAVRPARSSCRSTPVGLAAWFGRVRLRPDECRRKAVMEPWAINLLRMLVNAILWSAHVEVPADGAPVNLDAKALPPPPKP